jgi:phospholipase/carboxylesterase
MPYRRIESKDAIVLSPGVTPTGSVIWLHGLGADGSDFVPIVDELRSAVSTQIRYIFPHAPVRPVTINNGLRMRAWYDILSFGPERAEDEAGVRASAQLVSGFVADEVAAGVPEERIVVAGFSQGGAMALHIGLRWSQRLAGVMALSAYLPVRASLAADASPANRETPILMCHGVHDGVVPLSLGLASRDHLQSLGYRVEWRTYAMEHQVSADEVNDIGGWLQRVLA